MPHINYICTLGSERFEWREIGSVVPLTGQSHLDLHTTALNHDNSLHLAKKLVSFDVLIHGRDQAGAATGARVDSLPPSNSIEFEERGSTLTCPTASKVDFSFMLTRIGRYAERRGNGNSPQKCARKFKLHVFV